MDVQEKKIFIEEKISNLISYNSDIDTIISVGSFSQKRFDKYSDIDLLIFSNNIKKYLVSSSPFWKEIFGNYLTLKLGFNRQESVGKCKIICDNGVCFEFTVLSIDRVTYMGYFLNHYSKLPKRFTKKLELGVFSFYELVKRGICYFKNSIRVEKIINKAINYAEKNPRPMLNINLLQYKYENFLQNCYTASIKLKKSEHLHTLLFYDPIIKKELLWMIERYTSLKNNSTDFYFNGLKIADWGGSQLTEDILNTFLYKDSITMLKALLLSIKIFKEFSHPLMAHCSLKINARFEAFLEDFINKLIADI